jgi:hypothetical protein
MNYTRIALASLGAFVAYFVFGGLIFGMVPAMKKEFERHANLYRDHDGIMKVMPIGMGFMFISIAAVATLYAMVYRPGFGAGEGARFGVLIALFVLGAFVVHNYVNLRIGVRLTLVQAVTYFVQWVLMGVVIGAIYR